MHWGRAGILLIGTAIILGVPTFGFIHLNVSTPALTLPPVTENIEVPRASIPQPQQVLSSMALFPVVDTPLPNSSIFEKTADALDVASLPKQMQTPTPVSTGESGVLESMSMEGSTPIRSSALLGITQAPEKPNLTPSPAEKTIPNSDCLITLRNIE